MSVELSLIQRIRATTNNGKGRFVVAVHDGLFNLDETLCLAMVQFMCNIVGAKMFLIRTRKKEKLRDSHIVIDVGMQHKPEEWRFDHHQNGGAGSREPRRGEETGVPYSAIGLFWKHFGFEFCCVVLNNHSEAYLNEDQVKKLVEKVDVALIEGICALDTGHKKLCGGGLKIPTLANMIASMNVVSISPWATGSDAASYQLDMQLSTLDFLIKMLIGCIMREADTIANKGRVTGALKKASMSGEPRILVLDNGTQAWRSFMSKNPKILLVVQPQVDGTWGVLATNNTVNDREFTFPKEWGGLEPEELRAVSGLGGSIFCHTEGFFLSTNSITDAVQAATKGLELFDASVEENEDTKEDSTDEEIEGVETSAATEAASEE